MNFVFEKPSNAAPREVSLDLGREYGGVYTAFIEESDGRNRPHYSIHNESMTECRGDVPLHKIEELEREIGAGNQAKVFRYVHSPFA